MHHLFEQLTRTLSGDFMRRDDCCGGNGGEPVIQCCKKERAPQRLNEREAETLIDLLYANKAADHDAFIAEAVITGRAAGVWNGAEFSHLPAGKVFVDGGKND